MSPRIYQEHYIKLDDDSKLVSYENTIIGNTVLYRFSGEIICICQAGI